MPMKNVNQVFRLGAGFCVSEVTGLDAFLSFLPRKRYLFLQNVPVVQLITSAEVHVKQSAVLTDRLGPDVLFAL